MTSEHRRVAIEASGEGRQAGRIRVEGCEGRQGGGRGTH